MTTHDTLRISMLSIDIAYADITANLDAVRRGTSDLPAGTDIVVLPELFTTGFIRSREKAEALALAAWPLAIDTLSSIASTRNCAMAGSMMHLDVESGKIFNRAFFIEPDGSMWHYDKRHLFAMGAEAEVFSPGEKPSPIICYRGWNVALSVCYDIRFPAWIRNVGLKYDLLLVPANWPEARAFAWSHLLQARAIENQAYVVGANRSGEDKMGFYTGQSYVCGFTGHFLHCDESGRRLDAAMSKSELDEFRNQFPFWRDADDIIVR